MENELISISGHEHILVSSLVVILVTGSITALVFQRLKLALVPAYLISGIVVGPYGLGLVPSTGVLEEIAHLAVVLLLFSVGMELHIASLKKDARVLLGTALLSCLLTCIAGFSLGQLFGLSTAQSLIFAMGFSLSSTAVVLRLLSNSRQLVLAHGQLSLAILVTQDLLVLFMLAAIPTIAGWESVATASQRVTAEGFWVKELLAAPGIIVLFIAGQKLLPRLLAESLHKHSSEVLMICTVAAALVAGVVTEKLGFSLEMGAFLVGFLLASSPFRYQLSGQIAPVRNLLMAIFFTTLGMELNLAIVIDSLGIIIAATLLLLVTKAVCIGFSAWLFGVHPRIAILCGMMLSQAGEFSLIVFEQAGDYSIFSSHELSLVIGIVIVSLIVTPGLFALAKRISNLGKFIPISPFAGESAHSIDGQQILSITGEHIIVAGYGPAGQKVCAHLASAGVPFTVVEMNSDTVRREKLSGLNIVYGDISNPAVLEGIHIDRARAMILTFPDTSIAVRTAAQARSMNQQIEIVARAASSRERTWLEATGILDAVVDEELSALEMVKRAHRFTRQL